jgi:hypothetical protein
MREEERRRDAVEVRADADVITIIRSMCRGPSPSRIDAVDAHRYDAAMTTRTMSRRRSTQVEYEQIIERGIFSSSTKPA